MVSFHVLKTPGVDRDQTLKNFIVYGVETVAISFSPLKAVA